MGGGGLTKDEVPPYGAGGYTGSIGSPAMAGSTGSVRSSTNYGTFVQPNGSTLFVDPRPRNETGGVPTPGTGGGGGGTPGINSIVQGLLAPGLVPDIARQSAELSAGRGVAGSPAGASTAVRMSEQNYQQRLALANSLLSGESQRTLPYQITPYQQALLDLQRQQLQNQRDIAFRNQINVTGLKRYGQPSNAGRGGGGNMLTGTPSYSGPSGAFGAGGNPFSSNASTSSYLFGLGGGGGQQLTLDDIYDELGFGDFGNLPGDTTTDYGQYPEPPDFSYDMWD